MELNEEKEIEKEELYDGSEPSGSRLPFDPKAVDIIPTQISISNIIDRLANDEIDLEPDFQRNPDLWNDTKQSRLIESLMIRIPLPSFYFDTQGDYYIVVDGLQRLYAMKRFFVTEDLKLKNLEYLKEYEGLKYSELPGVIQRRIREQNVTVYIIRRNTPDNVKISIFNRINTGGLVLNPTEIKNSVYRGKVSNLIKELASSEEFRIATNYKIKTERMQDRELVIRFLAFYLLGKEKYQGNLEEFLISALEELRTKDDSVFELIRRDFKTSMNRCHELFRENAFRKTDINHDYSLINKPLFECVSVTFAHMEQSTYDMIIQSRNLFITHYKAMLDTDEYRSVITSGTATERSVYARYQGLHAVIDEVTNDQTHTD